MQLKKRRTLKTDSDVPITNFLSSHTQSSKPIKLPLLLLPSTPQKRNNLSFHQHPNKASSDQNFSQNFKTFRGRSITLNKKPISQFIEPIPQQLLEPQRIVNQQNILEWFEKTKKIKQQSRTQNYQAQFLNKKKIPEYLNKINNLKQQKKMDQFKTKQNDIQLELSNKKLSFQCFQKLIPKYHQEYTNQLIKQLSKFSEFGYCHFQDKEVKCLTDYEIALSMSEIQEINEDGLSSIAQSTFCNKVC